MLSIFCFKEAIYIFGQHLYAAVTMHLFIPTRALVFLRPPREWSLQRFSPSKADNKKKYIFCCLLVSQPLIAGGPVCLPEVHNTDLGLS